MAPPFAVDERRRKESVDTDLDLILGIEKRMVNNINGNENDRKQKLVEHATFISTVRFPSISRKCLSFGNHHE